ncbi:FK506-binding protein 5-like isoform X2 [Aedes albopictus]|uniref:Zonadhesin n=1 Tax=Aedes albopictus TaxID=7160 RepID=A0ABM2A5X8_AEDAL
MKIIQSVLLVTAIAVTVAFPTPQEEKTTSKTAKDEEHVPTVQKIEIHVEVKAMSPDVKMPATVTVSEAHEPLASPKDKNLESKKSEDSVQVTKASETSKPSETVELHKIKKIQVVVQPTPAEESVAKKSDVKSDVEGTSEKVEQVKSLPVAVKSVPSETVKEVEKEKTTLEQKPTTSDALSTTSESKSVKIENSQAKSAEPRQDTATSQPRPVIVEAPVMKSNENKLQDLEDKIETTKAVKVETKQQAKDDDDSKEDNSSEESPKDTVRVVSDETPEDAVKESKAEMIKDEKETKMQTDDALKETVVPVVTEGMKQGAKSVEDETVIPIVEDLPNKKQSVEAEPTYRMIPVTVVIEKPKVKEITIRTVAPVEKKEEEKPVEKKEEAKVIEPESGAEKSVESEMPKETIAKVDVSASPVADADSVTPEEELPLVKAIDPITVKADVQELTVTEEQKEDTPATRTVDPIKDTVEPVTVEVSAVNVAEESLKAVEEPVPVAEPSPAVEPEEVVQQDAAAADEPAKEAELKSVEPMMDEGSSTKAAVTESETAEKKVEDSSISSSTTTKALEDVTSTSEVMEKVEEAAAKEVEASTTTTTTTTTPAPVKTEGKKGKKKLPGSNNKQNTI